MDYRQDYHDSFQEGRAAHDDGLSLEDNPYSEPGPSKEGWTDGWRHAEG